MTKSYQFGFVPNLPIKILRLLIKTIKVVFFLNFNNKFSNEFIQDLKISKKVTFDNKEIIFRTGHGRLDWRVKSFFKEEPLIIEWIKSFSKKDIFFDVGANIGLYTLAALTKGAKVYAAELDPKNVSILFENLYLNKFFDECILLPFALGEKNKIEKIFYRDFSEGDALQSIGKETGLPTVFGNKFNTRQIVFQIDKIFDTFNLNQPNKIKIDVDGNERLVFEGGEKIISNCKELYIEDNNLESDEFVKNFLKLNNFTEIKKRPINKPAANKIIFNRLYKKN